jgi:Na+-driven multidrug efflux pump
MALYIIQSLIITPFTIYINGTGKIFIQTWQSIFSAIINIPLAIFLVKHFDMGSSGVILATIISLIPSLILAPLQTWKLTQGSTTKIFNK